MADIPDHEFDNAFNYAMKKICLEKGYGYDPKSGECIHTSVTCKRDHDYDGIEEIKVPFPNDIENPANDLPYGIWDSSKNKCMGSDYSFKKACVRKQMDYKEDAGVGWCFPSKKYCESNHIAFSTTGPVDLLKGHTANDSDGCNKFVTVQGKKVCATDCYRPAGQAIAEEIFGTTVVRGTKALFEGKVTTCDLVSNDTPNSGGNGCWDDQFCAGANNCQNKGFPGDYCLAGQDPYCRDYLSCNEPAFKRCCPDGVGGANACKDNPDEPYTSEDLCMKCCKGTREECIKRGKCVGTTCAYKDDEHGGKYFLPKNAECSMAGLKNAFTGDQTCGYYFDNKYYDGSTKKDKKPAVERKLSCRGLPIKCRGKGDVGAQCLETTQCMDGLWCGGLPIQCRTKSGPGEYCPLNNNACTGTCNSASRCTYPDGPDRGKVPTGTFCLAGQNQCKSTDYCKLTGSGVKCSPKLKKGERTCLSDGECVTGRCLWGKCIDKDGGDRGDFCTIGQGQCKSNYWCGGIPTECRSKKSPGSFCMSGSECTSNKCVNGNCTLPNGKLPKGAECWSSSSCDTNLVCRGLPLKCSDKGGYNSLCTYSSHCKDPYKCIIGRCQQPKGVGGACTAGQHSHCAGNLECPAGACVDPNASWDKQAGDTISGWFSSGGAIEETAKTVGSALSVW